MRRYNKWVGNPKGSREDLKRCVAEVSNNDRSILFHQCLRKRGFGEGGLFCYQHTKLEPRHIPEDEDPDGL